MTSKSKLDAATVDQVEALRAFATKYGPKWKSILMAMWIKGIETKEPNGHLLRSVRNNLGPSWLNGVTL